VTLPATDNFNRADANPIGGNWTTCSDVEALKIATNQVRSSGFSDGGAYWNADSFAADHWSECKIIAASNDGGPAVRCSSSGFYYCTPVSGGTIYRYKTGGNWVTLGTSKFTAANGDVLRLQATGTSTTTLKVYVNGTLVATVTDSSSPLTSGAAGLECYEATLLDDWQGSNAGTSVTVTSVAATCTAAAIAPAVAGTRNPTVTGVAATCAAAAIAPVVTGIRNVTVTGVVATCTAAALAPTVTAAQNGSLTAVTAACTADGIAPTVTAIRNGSVTAVVATCAAAASVPLVSGAANVTAVVTNAAASMGLPTLTATANLTAVAASASAAVPAPTLSAAANVTAVAATSPANAPAPAATGIRNASSVRIAVVLPEP